MSSISTFNTFEFPQSEGRFFAVRNRQPCEHQPFPQFLDYLPTGKFRRPFVWKVFFQKLLDLFFIFSQIPPRIVVSSVHFRLSISPPSSFSQMFRKHRSRPIDPRRGIHYPRYDSMSKLPNRYRYAIPQCRQILAQFRTGYYHYR